MKKPWIPSEAIYSGNSFNYIRICSLIRFVFVFVHVLQKWLSCFEEQKCMAFAVNSHNRDNIREV